MGFIVNVAELMMLHFLPRPRIKCRLDVDRAETLTELGIIRISGTDCDYHDNNSEG